jgi:hypothetical protein
MRIKVGTSHVDLISSGQSVTIHPMRFKGVRVIPKVTLKDDGSIVLSYALNEQAQQGFILASSYSESFIPALRNN